jgi:amino acid transporter
MAFTVGSYAELATRFPVSAGEAAYVRAAFRSRTASTLTGLMTILQMTMAARVVYGMARQGDLPGFAGRVHPRTATPLFATALIVATVIALALLFPLERLAEITSLATLVVFAMVNLALLRLRYRHVHAPGPHVHVPLWVPAVGFAACVAMIASALLG